MKKKLKKLELHRETLTALERRDLAPAHGGGYGTAYPGCWSGRQTCASCELTCTTNYC